MQTQKYSVTQQLIETLLAWVKTGDIAIPEIQRPFVWDATKVRDLMDSLYQGYPVGYVIAWQNPNVRLKDGKLSSGKKILIDGQQRITALRAAILGEKVVNKDYKQVRIRIAFHPVEQKFEVQNPAILKDKTWVADIADSFKLGSNTYKAINEYKQLNPEAPEDIIVEAFSNLFDLVKKPIGIIDLASDLDIETVTEIFIRINSQGVVLSQADFVMSKIAANEAYGGNILRKAIDYFCHLAIAPEFFQSIQDNDQSFAATDYFQKMTWLRNELEELYDPSYTDVLRVAFATQFHRGKLSDLVSLLSGRNFETKTFEEQIAVESFEKLGNGVRSFINEHNFKSFLLIIKSAGFATPEMIRSQNALNFAYILYLRLKGQGENPALIAKYVRRWFVYSLLTGRYSGSAETIIDLDLRQMQEKDFASYLMEKETGELSDAFWNATLVQDLDTSSASSPYYSVFVAAQVKANDHGFLSTDTHVTNLITIKGDVHHLYPKDYLKKSGLSRGKYNQIANMAYMDSTINVQVGNKAPVVYMQKVREQIVSKEYHYGGITSEVQLMENLRMNCIPETIFDGNLENYEAFLSERRRLMAQKMKAYYESL